MSNETENTAEAWESGKLGREEEYVSVADIDQNDIDEAAELKLISIRLQKHLIEDMKMIAKLNGIGYQPLIRQIITRFVNAEKKAILRDQYKHKMEEEVETEDCEKIAAYG